jgi:hypothetical protein
MTGDSRLGTIFDQDAALYDAVRPTYPDVLFERLQDVARLGPGSRVLEIGPERVRRPSRSPSAVPRRRARARPVDGGDRP